MHLFILLQSLCVPLWNIKDINVYFICFVNYMDTAFLQMSILEIVFVITGSILCVYAYLFTYASVYLIYVKK